MKLWVLAALLLSSVCSLTVSESKPTQSPPAASASPSPTKAATSPQPSSVLPPVRSPVLAIIAGPMASNVTGAPEISLVGSDGATIASAPMALAPFRPNVLMSSTSASTTRLYYLYAGSEVRFLLPDGSSGTATQIAVGANQQAGFSVSPDDTKIAVTIFNYSAPPAQGPPVGAYAGMRLYVEDVQGGGHHAEIFSSTTLAEFPIGWVGGRLVMAVGEPTCCQALTLNPYAATSYHIVDPATGNRLVSLCDGGTPLGPVTTAGLICNTGPGSFTRWDGGPIPAPAAMTPSAYLNALSPDGTRIAVGGQPIQIEGPRGAFYPLAESGYVFG